MKYILSAIIFVFLISAAKLRNEDSKLCKEDNEFSDRIRLSFRGGKPKILASCLSQHVELVIDSKKNNFQKIFSQ